MQHNPNSEMFQAVQWAPFSLCFLEGSHFPIVFDSPEMDIFIYALSEKHMF